MELTHAIELEITDLAFGGDGVGRIDGRVIFVPFALPGEICSVRITEDKKKFLRGHLERVLKPSPHRIEARCPVFKKCGGCRYQHVEYASELEWKARQVQQLLNRIGPGVGLEVLRPIVPCPSPYGYRNRVQVRVRHELPGFIGIDGHRHVPVAHCPIACDAVNRQLQTLSEQRCRGHREDERVTLRAANGPSAGFSQVNLFMEQVLRDAVKEALAPGGGRLLELYAGNGYFTRDAVGCFSRIDAVEWDSRLVAEGRRSLGEKVHWIESDVSILPVNYLNPDATEKSNTLLLDPPREGLPPHLAQRLAAATWKKIVYLSCHPATLARDLRVLTDRYRITSVRPIDLFPRTPHIEILTVLEMK